MESSAHYRTVGLIVILLLAGLVTTGLWLSVGFSRAGYTYYAIYMTEPVSGLTKDSLVKYNGVKVGVIKSIELNKFKPQIVRLVIAVENTTPITPYTYATIISQGITGGTYLGLASDNKNLKSLRKVAGEPYLVISTKPSFYHELETTVKKLSEGFTDLFNPTNIQNLNQTIASLRKLSDTLGSNNQNIDKSLKELPNVINKFSKMTETMASASKKVEETMQSGKESFDKINRQAIPPTVLFLRRLDAIGSNIEQLTEQLKQNPSIMLRGTTPPPKGPGE